MRSLTTDVTPSPSSRMPPSPCIIACSSVSPTRPVQPSMSASMAQDGNCYRRRQPVRTQIMFRVGCSSPSQNVMACLHGWPSDLWIPAGSGSQLKTLSVKRDSFIKLNFNLPGANELTNDKYCIECKIHGHRCHDLVVLPPSESLHAPVCPSPMLGGQLFSHQWVWMWVVKVISNFYFTLCSRLCVHLTLSLYWCFLMADHKTCWFQLTGSGSRKRALSAKEIQFMWLIAVRQKIVLKAGCSSPSQYMTACPHDWF